MFNRKNIFLWSLYDFANSISTVVFFLYFSQWLVIDNKVSDIWYNLLFVGATALLLLTSPVLGSIADKRRVRMPYLNFMTIMMFITLLITSMLAVFLPTNRLTIIGAIFFFMLANYFYQFSFTFYNALLSSMAPLRSQGFVSGIGQAAGWTGQIVGLVVTLPLATGAIYLFGNPGRAQTFLPATILFFIFSLPIIFFLKETVKPKKVAINIFEEYKSFFRSFIQLCKSPGVGKFLLGYFLFNDGMLTAINNFPIYLEQVFKVSDQTKTMLLVGILIMSVIGALFSGWIADKIGLKKTLLAILFGWTVTFPLMAVMTNFTYFTMLTVVLGFLFGSTWTITRAVMSYLSPPDRLNHAFSYYTAAERFSSFVGPLVWGLVTYLLLDMGELRYRVALISMTLFIVAGLWIVKSIPERVIKN